MGITRMHAVVKEKKKNVMSLSAWIVYMHTNTLFFARVQNSKWLI